MDRTEHRDPFGRPLRPWADPLIEAPPADATYPVLPAEGAPVLTEPADSPPRKIDLLDDPSIDLQPTCEAVDERRFTLLDLMTLMTAAAILFALMGQLPPTIFAGVAGGLSLLMLACLSLVEVQKPIFRYGWWILFLTYLIASATAAITG